MSGQFLHATMFAHHPTAANGILNDMDEKNEMNDMEGGLELQSFGVSELRSFESRL